MFSISSCTFTRIVWSDFWRDSLVVSCAAVFAPRFIASGYDILVPGTKAFFDCFCSEVWVGSCFFFLGLDSPTTITSSLLEAFPLLSPSGRVTRFIFEDWQAVFGFDLRFRLRFPVGLLCWLAGRLFCTWISRNSFLSTHFLLIFLLFSLACSFTFCSGVHFGGV